MQADFFDSEDIRKSKLKPLDANQLSMLPVSPLQERQDIEDPILTKCEFEIMQMVLSGHSIQEMALKIFITVAGLKYRLTNIYWKFNVVNRLGLIRKTSSTGIQFRTDSGVRHTFHNAVNLRAHEKKENHEPEISSP